MPVKSGSLYDRLAPSGDATKRARRASPRALFALLDLDGTLFHMMPESDVPGNLEVICETIVPLPARPDAPPHMPKQVMARAAKRRELLNFEGSVSSVSVSHSVSELICWDE